MGEFLPLHIMEINGNNRIMGTSGAQQVQPGRAPAAADLARWRAGARVAGPARPPQAEVPAQPQPQAPPPSAEPFPYLRLPGGSFAEADPKVALRRQLQSEADLMGSLKVPEDPEFRPPSELGQGAPAKVVAEDLQAAIERQTVLKLGTSQFPDAVQEFQQRRDAIREQASAAAYEALQRRLTEAQTKRITQLGEMLQLVASRFSVGASPAGNGASTLDTAG